MLSTPPTALVSNGLLNAALTAPPFVYLLLAALSLSVALRALSHLRRAFPPLSALIQIVATTIAATVAVGVALLLMAAAAVGTH